MIGPRTSAPDLIVPVIGYRGWRVIDGQLVSPVTDTRWGREMTAECLPLYGTYYCRNRYGTHDAPLPEGRCGLYAYHDPRDVMYGDVLGAVVATGRLQVHEGGVRAERVRIVVIAPSGASLGIFPVWRTRWAVSRIARRMGVEFVPHEALVPLAAQKYGSSIPPALREFNDELREAA